MNKINEQIVLFKINKMMSKFDLNKDIDDNKRIINNIGLHKILEICHYSEFLCLLVSQKHDEDKVKIIFEHVLNNCFAGIYEQIIFINGKNKNSENFLQVAIKSGYSEEFIIYILKEYGYDSIPELNCNSTDKKGRTILHTAALYSSKRAKSLNINELLFVLDNYTKFDISSAKDNNGNTFVDIISNDIGEGINYGNGSDSYYKSFIKSYHKAMAYIKAQYYNINFGLFLDKITYNINYNKNTILENFGVENNGYFKRYNLKKMNELLFLCVSEKYENEEFILDKIERLLETGLMDVNSLENMQDDFIEIAIKSEYSEEFILKILDLAIEYDYEKDRLTKILCTMIIHNNPCKTTKKSNVYNISKFYRELCERGLDLISADYLSFDIISNYYKKIDQNNENINNANFIEISKEIKDIETIRRLNYWFGVMEINFKIHNILQYYIIKAAYNDLLQLSSETNLPKLIAKTVKNYIANNVNNVKFDNSFIAIILNVLDDLYNERFKLFELNENKDAKTLKLKKNNNQ